MARFRLTPTAAQEAVLRDHCGHARYVWNLAVEQHSWWRPGRSGAPTYIEQCRQLTGARAEHGWLRAGSQMVQALFRCVACKFTLNADVNAARNIAAGHAVTARGGDGVARPMNREPQLLLQPA